MIKIKAEIPHGMKCSLRIGELEKTLDSVDRETVFELDEGRVYDVEAYIGTPARSADEKKFDRLFFSLSLPFRWISALADVVPGRWYDDLCPYSAKVEFKIGGETGSDCLIRYSIPEDAVLKGTYLRPLITVSCSSCPTIEFSENTESFDHCYRSHAKKCRLTNLYSCLPVWCAAVCCDKAFQCSGKPDMRSFAHSAAALCIVGFAFPKASDAADANKIQCSNREI